LQVVSAIVPSENNAASTFTLPEHQSLSKATGDPQARDPAQLGVRLDQRYTLCHRLGKGGMGTVYLAIDQSLNRFAAIKIFNPLVLQKFRDQVVP
jgi:serine/threonine protein kinase